ncbi:hypothetical protein AZE42_10887 [Rhizopogon vesiculosus]|uniref:Uncharacterized protein n=1 Tax=Rhizopogon vesiculosus TaxID=180088 RepID=A0A1J8QWJ7_9AGAM|nr:hypothetical protein AZE42_10887 [Rhizopogon vesiculosus]
MDQTEKALVKHKKRNSQWEKPVRGPLEKPCPKLKNPRKQSAGIIEEDKRDQGEYFDILEVGDDSEYEDDDE